VTVERMQRLRVRAGGIAAGFAAVRADYENLSEDHGSDPKTKEALRLDLLTESVFMLFERLFVAARLTIEIDRLERLDQWIASLDTNRPLTIGELRERFAFYDVLLTFGDLLCDHADLVVGGIEHLEAARLKINEQNASIFWPVETALWVFPGGDKTWFSPAGGMWSESPLVTAVDEQFELFRRAEPWAQYYADRNAALTEGLEQIARYSGEIEANGTKLYSAIGREQKRLKWWDVPATLAEVVGYVELAYAGTKIVISIPKFLSKTLPALAKSLLKAARSGLHEISTNPRAIMKGGYRALVDALKRGARLGAETASDGAPVVGPRAPRTRAAPKPPPREPATGDPASPRGPGGRRPSGSLEEPSARVGAGGQPDDAPGAAAGGGADPADIVPEPPPFDPSGSLGAAKPWTRSSRLRYYQNIAESGVGLPTLRGKWRYVPPDDWHPSMPFPRSQDGKGWMDKFGNTWRKGEPVSGRGDDFEWDVTLGRHASDRWRRQAATKGKGHLNVSPDGDITH
jgi:hypothetical protein